MFLWGVFLTTSQGGGSKPPACCCCSNNCANTHTRASTERRFCWFISGQSHLSGVQRSSNFGHSLRQQEEIIQLCSCKRSSGGTYQQQRPTLRLGQLEEAPAPGRDGQTWPVHKPEGCSSTVASFSKWKAHMRHHHSKATKPAFLAFMVDYVSRQELHFWGVLSKALWFTSCFCGHLKMFLSFSTKKKILTGQKTKRASCPFIIVVHNHPPSASTSPCLHVISSPRSFFFSLHEVNKCLAKIQVCLEPDPLHLFF